MANVAQSIESLCFSETIELLKSIDPEEIIPVLIGPPGISKSALAKQFCVEKGIPPSRQAFLSMALNDTGDIIGFPYKVANPDGSDSGRMGFAVPPWWLGQYDPATGTRRPLDAIHEPYDDGHEYCLVIDEANRDADPQKQAAMINLFLERQVQGRYLPRNTYIILSINEGNQYLVEDFDPAVKNRIMPIQFRPLISEWLAYFDKSKQFNLFVRGFVQGPGGKWFIPADDTVSDTQFCSPRSLTKVGSLLNGFAVNTESGLVRMIHSPKNSWKILKIAIKAVIGEKAGKDFIGYLESECERFKDKYLKVLDPDSAEIERLRKLHTNDLRKEISTANSVKIGKIIEAFYTFMMSNNFGGWDVLTQEVAMAIVHYARISEEDKVDFIEKCKKLKATNIFDLALRTLNTTSTLSNDEKDRLNAIKAIFEPDEK